MRIVPHIETEIRRAIRDERAKDPIISIYGIQEALSKKFGRDFVYAYVSKMVKKVEGEAKREVSTTKLEKRLSISREKFRILEERLMQIVNWDASPPQENETFSEYIKRVKPPRNQDVIEAAKTIALLDQALLRAERDCGLYRDDSIPNAHPTTTSLITADTTRSISTAFERWGLVRPQTITAQLTERTMTLHATTTDITPAA